MIRRVITSVGYGIGIVLAALGGLVALATWMLS